MSLNDPMASTGADPYSDVGTMPDPIWTPSNGLAHASRPIKRLIHPLRTCEPGSASSTSSMAEKWLRLGTGRPTAWTAANLPDTHSGRRGE